MTLLKSWSIRFFSGVDTILRHWKQPNVWEHSYVKLGPTNLNGPKMESWAFLMDSFICLAFFHTSAPGCGDELFWANHRLLRPQLGISIDAEGADGWTRNWFWLVVSSYCLPKIWSVPVSSVHRHAVAVYLGPPLKRQFGVHSWASGLAATFFPRHRGRLEQENIRPVRPSGSLRPLLWRHVWSWTSAWAEASRLCLEDDLESSHRFVATRDSNS